MSESKIRPSNNPFYSSKHINLKNNYFKTTKCHMGLENGKKMSLIIPLLHVCLSNREYCVQCGRLGLTLVP